MMCHDWKNKKRPSCQLKISIPLDLLSIQQCWSKKSLCKTNALFISHSMVYFCCWKLFDIREIFHMYLIIICMPLLS